MYLTVPQTIIIFQLDFGGCIFPTNAKIAIVFYINTPFLLSVYFDIRLASWQTCYAFRLFGL